MLVLGSPPLPPLFALWLLVVDVWFVVDGCDVIDDTTNGTQLRPKGSRLTVTQLHRKHRASDETGMSSRMMVHHRAVANATEIPW